MSLTPEAAAQEWKAGKLRPVYCLYGEDSAAKAQALETLKAAVGADPFNLAELSGDGDAQAAEAVSACLTPPMFAERRLVLMRCAKLGAAGRKALAEYLKDPLPTTTLAVLCPDAKPDLKDALAAASGAHGGQVVFRPLKPEEAASRLRSEARAAGLELSPEAADAMVEEAGVEWGILRSELEKLLLFAAGRKKAGIEDVLACLGYRREANPFELPRSIGRRDRAAAVGHLLRLLEEGADPFALLYQITSAVNRQLKAKRMVKAGLGQERIFRELRLNAYYDRDYLQQVAKTAETALEGGLRACLETEVALKSKSWLEPGLELQRLVARLTR